MADLVKQHREIDALNKKYRGKFRLIKGIEANIRGDGSLTWSETSCAGSSWWSRLHTRRSGPADQTARMVNAVGRRACTFLVTPAGGNTGRARRHADWDQVFKAARHSNVAIEIDGDPSRQDIDYDLAKRAVDAGCSSPSTATPTPPGAAIFRDGDRPRSSRRRTHRSHRQLLAGREIVGVADKSG